MTHDFSFPLTGVTAVNQPVFPSVALTRIRQRFSTARVEDVEAAVRAELNACGVTPRPGSAIAIAVGSRGIAGNALIVRQVVEWVKACRAKPFIVPAMGSHGGATAEGQREVLAGYGITEDAVGAPIRSSMEVVQVPAGDLPTPVFFDRLAYEADGVILVNRVKPHTSFRGRYESGLMKMMAIGLGKDAGARAIHALGVRGLREVMPAVAGHILRIGKILLGVAVVENAREEVALVRVLPPDRIPEEEPRLLEQARRNLPGLPVDDLDILIVDEMGKNISGLGMDPNVIGRLKIPGQPEPDRPRIRFIIVRDLTAETHGNALGMGLADIITRRLFDKIDLKATYENMLTTTFLERGKIPVIAETDQEALAIACRALGRTNPNELRIIRITNTLHLEELYASEAVVQELRGRPDIEIHGPAGPWLEAAPA